jgi:hypothetical protein
VFFRTPAKAESGVDGKAEEPQPPATAADVDAPTGLVSMARPAKPAASNGTSSGEDTVVVKVQPPAAGRSAPSGDGPSGDAPSGDTPDKDGTADTVEVNGGTGRSPSGTRSG